MSLPPYKEYLRVGIVQTTVDAAAAWGGGVKMADIEEERAVAEIQQHLASFALENPRPQIIILPEVSIPLGFRARLRRIATKMNSIIIGGLDFEPVAPGATQIHNRAVVIVPNRWTQKHSSMATVRHVGKTYPSYEENKLIEKNGCTFRQVPEIWIFDAGVYGRFGVVICFDLLDLERVATYRLQLQHLFVLAYNKDITTFDHSAEALSRMIYCNIVICNTGNYGGSIAVSPYKEAFDRTIYRHSGQRLSTSQSISLPVEGLIQAQTGNWPLGKERKFKALPPGASPVTGLSTKSETVTPTEY